MDVVVLTCLVALASASMPGHRSLSDVSWNELAAHYAYSPPPLFRVYQEKEPSKSASITHIVFPGMAGQYARCTLVVPKTPGKHPLVLLLHGLGGSKEHALRMYSEPLLNSGCAVLAMDAPNHGQSQSPAVKELMDRLNTKIEHLALRKDLIEEAYQMEADIPFESFFTSVVHDGILNCRLALDVVLKRDDLDGSSVHAIGNSMGAMMGAILASVDSRVRSVCLISGGDPIISKIDPTRIQSRELNLRACPSLYVQRLAGRPMVMFNGLSDQTMPPASAERLFSAAKDPKQIRWYASGHALPKVAVSEAIEWVRKQAVGAPAPQMQIAGATYPNGSR